jgi:hypothetical protein
MWKDRARLGVNLGFSSQHARSAHLIVSLTMGCVSPQFHCTLDEHFSTIKNYALPPSTWQEKEHSIEAAMVCDPPECTSIHPTSSNHIQSSQDPSSVNTTNEGVDMPSSFPQELPEFNPQDDLVPPLPNPTAMETPSTTILQKPQLTREKVSPRQEVNEW